MVILGRPPVLDATKMREIAAILAVGCSRATAARYVGCHVDTIRRTALRDEDFAVQLRQAETTHEILHLKNINAAAKEGRYWRAAAWALERGYPQRYAQRHPHVVTEEQVSQMLAQFAGIVVEEVPELERREKILARLDAVTAELQSPTGLKQAEDETSDDEMSEDEASEDQPVENEMQDNES